MKKEQGQKMELKEVRTEWTFARKMLVFILGYAIFVSLFFLIVKDDWSITSIATDPVNRDAITPELTEGKEISQEFATAADRMKTITLYANMHPGAADKQHALFLTMSSEGAEFYSQEISYTEIRPDGQLVIPVESVAFPENGSVVTLSLRADGEVSFWYGTSKSAGKFQVNVETSGLKVDGQPVDGELVLIQRGEIYLRYMDYYWITALILFILLLAFVIYSHACRLQNKSNILNRGIDLIKQYKYLLKTLVIRDFKIKYKASVLGVLWSFLNPLLMTFVYMFVFSTLFRSSIENFVVYLMSGIILFNYFSESSNLGMQSIVGNAGLIKKVYMPKYILPISKVLSSSINLFISLIPLLIMMALTGVRFSKSLFLIPLVLIFLILFSAGVSLLLASAMVYFRDVQFLWGILLTILNFVSPIFYPESIIPARLITLYHMNPMYQYLFFMRTIILGGISPTPVTYLYCALASAVTLGAGLMVFRKVQSKFVLHL